MTAPLLDLQDTLSAASFARLAAFIHDYSGIKMPMSKKTMLEGRLRRRLRDAGVATLDDYCDYLFDDGGLETELIPLIDAVTTNKTDFFREPQHFDYITSVMLPEMESEGRTSIRAWSAAASTGAEAYTLAMVLDDFCSARRGWDYSIFATDLCSQVLTQALAGVYPAAMIEPVPSVLRQRYLRMAKDPARTEVRISPHLRAKVAFARLNLMDQRYGAPRDLDIIFCRNILIYFDKPTQAAVLRRLCGHLRKGGRLILGHSETIVGVDLPVRPVASTVFEKV